ncbi:COX15/CtaA family protein [Silvimonas iriomotensis]|uniref:Heme A synthase n=1 Tax=Silvimonas iriomotensis TaxID=449662 RepID=A0ABQ2PE52_9NEIS|nr:COX15/CtaA family protein [Silvimonas iriomotensis]GGP23833.1 heme A synthase [Silvimonas iriomotensis]
MRQSRLRYLAWLAVIWTFGLVMLGSFVRLSDAGLGCPDWPGCYGHLTVPQAAHEIAHAAATFGAKVEPDKGWKEMIHRYVAGGLVLIVLALTAALYRQRQRFELPASLVFAPLLVIVLQALLGMWTVTLKLMPAVVTAHLLGGMTMLALLSAIALRGTLPRLHVDHANRTLAWVVLCAVLCQLILGGLVSSNYAGLACDGFPACRGSFAAPDGLMDMLRVDRQLGLTSDGMPLPISHLAAIHWLHRLGALVVTLTTLWLVLRLWPANRNSALLLLAALAVQVGLGIANVLLSLPLPLAVLHNGGAAFLLFCLTSVLARSRAPRTFHVYTNTHHVFTGR